MDSIGKHGVISMLLRRFNNSTRSQSPAGVVSASSAIGSDSILLRDFNKAAYEWLEHDDPQKLVELAGGMLAVGFLTSQDFNAILEATGKVDA